jgi:hypothetical protein
VLVVAAPASPRAGRAGALYVEQVGATARPAGGMGLQGRRALPSRAPLTRRRAALGQRVIWFWCRRAGACQRTLAMQGRARPGAASRFRVVVRGYDDFGRGRRVAGAIVRYDGRRAGRTGVVSRCSARADRPASARHLAARDDPLVPLDGGGAVRRFASSRRRWRSWRRLRARVRATRPTRSG